MHLTEARCRNCWPVPAIFIDICPLLNSQLLMNTVDVRIPIASYTTIQPRISLQQMLPRTMTPHTTNYQKEIGSSPPYLIRLSFRHSDRVSITYISFRYDIDLAWLTLVQYLNKCCIIIKIRNKNKLSLISYPK